MHTDHANWLKIGDTVTLDFEWLDSRPYRRDKILNELILDEARNTHLFEIAWTSTLGFNVNLKPSSHTKIQWKRKRQLNITTAKHAKTYPIKFIFRGVT